MKTKLVLIVAFVAIGTIAAFQPPGGLTLITAAQAACDPGTHIDKTTVDETRDRLIKAGYKNPLHLRKGCDNAWHGTAVKGGRQVNVAVLPDGHIVRDGD